MIKFTKIEKQLLLLILVSAAIRAFIAGIIEFGNDEVYYWTYALYPDWSHFDHPPMVGFVIQLFTLNLWLDSEFFIRLASVVFMSVNTWLIYLIAKKIYNERAGFIAAFLYTSSVYCFVITGIFILPDTPQSLFWMLSIYFLIQVVSKENAEKIQGKYLLLAALTLGLGMLSKYTSVFLWVGFGLYILIFEQKWFRKWQLYVSLLISLFLVLPILIWNIRNDFISFTFHSERVDASGSSLHLDYFFREFFGQVVYNNPVLFVLTIIGLIALLKRKLNFAKEHKQILLLTTLPLIFLFLGFSLFRQTLPHWTSPSYMVLLVFPAAYLAEKFPKKLFNWPGVLAAALLLITLILGVLQINYGVFKLDNHTADERLGKNDFSMDMYGWKQIKENFEPVLKQDIENGTVDKDVILLSNYWFPAAHLDYYVARPLELKLLGIGSLQNIHKYAWINQYRGGFALGMDAYYITTSHNFEEPYYLSEYFEEIALHKKIPIMRGGKVAGYAFVYILKDYKGDLFLKDENGNIENIILL